jgi:hypothetical protein
VRQSSLLLVLFASALLGCTSALEAPPGEQSDLMATVVKDGIMYSLKIPATLFSLQDTLTGSFEVSNVSITSRRFDFGNQQQFGYMLIGAGTEPALYYPVIVQPATSYFTLAVAESRVFGIRTAFRDFNGQLIAPGEYTLKAFLLHSESAQVSLRITVQ